MKILAKISLTLILFMTSCNSQNEMDLINLDLSVEKNLLLNNKFITEKYDVYTDYTIYKTTDPKLFIVNNEDISGSLSSGDDLNTNKIFFYVNDEKGNIPFINLRSFVTEKTQLLHKVLQKKFGKPNYYKSVSFASYSIWENKTTNNIYLYEHNYGGTTNGVPLEEGILYIIDMNDKILLDRYTKATYSYYMDYLDKRADKNENYTYEQFAKEKKEKGAPRYLKAIENPVKH